MSRSYKHSPVFKSQGCKKWIKRYANKRVRKAKDVPNGKQYRKILNPWDINDWVWYVTLEDAMASRTRRLAEYDIMEESRKKWYEERYEEDINIHRAIEKWKRWYYWK